MLTIALPIRLVLLANWNESKGNTAIRERRKSDSEIIIWLEKIISTQPVLI
jgi:hypothetical protein